MSGHQGHTAPCKTVIQDTLACCPHAYMLAACLALASLLRDPGGSLICIGDSSSPAALLLSSLPDLWRCLGQHPQLSWTNMSWAGHTISVNASCLVCRAIGCWLPALRQGKQPHSLRGNVGPLQEATSVCTHTHTWCLVVVFFQVGTNCSKVLQVAARLSPRAAPFPPEAQGAALPSGLSGGRR